jgi:phosphoglycerate dehydrogenase-like enzyme
MTPVNVLVMAPMLGADLSYVADIDPRIVVLDGNDAFVADRRTEGEGAGPAAGGEADALLARADVLVLGYPVPAHVAGRAPRLRWAHHTQAGVSNFHRSDLWSSEITLTSGRGSVSATGIAEYVLAGALFFARGLHEGTRQKQAGLFSRREYWFDGVAGSVMGVIGFGGIGQEVGRLARAMGMRVVATRRSVVEAAEGVDGADLLLPADRLLDVAGQSDFLAVCSQLTEETRGMIDRPVLAAMKPEAILINIARAEEVDEDALIEAVRSGQIRGAVLDVHAGELDGTPPRRELVEMAEILLTPHISGLGDRKTDDASRALVRDNLQRYVHGQPLRNVVDRKRGY